MVGSAMTETIVALSYTKQRTMFGLVGIEIVAQKRTAYVRLAKQWSRDDMNLIPKDIATLYNKIKWGSTMADQQVGQHMLRSIENELQTGLQIITTQKNLKDPENIEKLKVMDITEMTQLTLSTKQDHRIQFPKKPTKDMIKLMSQMELFTEHTTESGTVSYFAPGDELDCLPRALMICCFAGRNSLEHTQIPALIQRGTIQQETAEQSFEKFFQSVLGDHHDLSDAHLNRSDKFKLFEKTKKRF